MKIILKLTEKEGSSHEDVEGAEGIRKDGFFVRRGGLSRSSGKTGYRNGDDSVSNSKSLDGRLVEQNTLMDQKNWGRRRRKEGANRSSGNVKLPRFITFATPGKHSLSTRIGADQIRTLHNERKEGPWE